LSQINIYEKVRKGGRKVINGIEKKNSTMLEMIKTSKGKK
jgi:starvation-inducible outer membrane lipoprotein